MGTRGDCPIFTGLTQESGRIGTVPGYRLSSFYRGFTLIELLVVISILSITLSFVIPRLVGREEAELKSSARRLLYSARQLSDASLFRKEKHILTIDKGERIYWEEGSGKKIKLPDGISIEEVVIGKERVENGEASITFFPSGLRDEAEIKLGSKGKGSEYTVVIPALGEGFEIREK